jgi:hypothetical protein
MQIIGRDCVYYFHDMIVEMIKWGFQEGKTLFGFGYDFRQSNRYVLNQPAISNTAIITKFLAPNRFFFKWSWLYNVWSISFPFTLHDLGHSCFA